MMINKRIWMNGARVAVLLSIFAAYRWGDLASFGIGLAEGVAIAGIYVLTSRR